MRWLILIPLLLAFSLASASAQTPRAPDDFPTPDLKRTAELIVEATNDFREQQELSPLKNNRQLQKAAEYFADYMASTDEYSHDADGKQPAERAEEYGYDYCIVLENIAYQYSSTGFRSGELSRRIQRGWEKSPGHRSNLLDPDVTQIGVAVAQSEESGYFYAVQMFGRPESLRGQFELRNTAREEVTYELDGEEFSLPPRYARTHYFCRPAKLVLQLEEDETQSLTPQDGEKLVVAEQDGQLRLVR